jgi:hypothetical protein
MLSMSRKAEGKRQQAAKDWPIAPSRDHDKLVMTRFREATSLNEGSLLLESICAICDEIGSERETYSIEELEQNCPAFFTVLRFRTIGSRGVRHLAQPNSYYDIKELTGLALSIKGIEPDGNVTICRPCYASLVRKVAPANSIWNDLWIGDVPPCLAQANMPTLMAINPIRFSAFCNKMMAASQGPQSSKAWGYRGIVYCHLQDTAAIYRSLPVPLGDFHKIFSVQFVGPVPERQEMAPLFSVSQVQVR